jgi:magnesium transporter
MSVDEALTPKTDPTPDTNGSPVVDCALYERGVRQGGALPLDTALNSAQEAAERSQPRDGESEPFVWIGLHEPSAEEFESIAHKFELHPLAVEDAVHAHQRPKLETYGETVFVVLKTVHYVDHQEVVDVGELMLFVGANFVVSVRHGSATALAQVRRDLEASPDRLRAGPAAVLHAVLDRVVDDYIVAADLVAEDVDDIECQVFSGDREDHAKRIYALKREVLAFQRSVKPLVDPLRRLSEGDVPHLDGDTAQYFRDVHDHLLRTADQVDGFSQLLNDILEANTSGVTMRQNEDMRKITAWVAIVAWITMIAGIYGMNFRHMPELNWVLGYPFALALMLGGAGGLYVLFKRNRWL